MISIGGYNMSYRAEVCVVLTAEGEKVLRDHLFYMPDNDTTKIQVIRLLDTYVTHTSTSLTGATLYYWENYEWYNNETVVEYFDQFFQDLDENEYLFLRLGEVLTDIKIRGKFWSNPFNTIVLRSIYFFSTPEKPISHN